MRPKRKIRQNIWGNWNGYEGRIKAHEFGLRQSDAEYWLKHGQLCEQEYHVGDTIVMTKFDWQLQKRNENKLN